MHNAIGRDIRPGQLASIIATISDWHENARDMLVSIEEKVAWAGVAQEDHKHHKEELEAKMEAGQAAIWRLCGATSSAAFATLLY